jgi:superfamily II DNA or RNA helicase
MAIGGEDRRADGFDAKFTSNFVPRNATQARVVSETVNLLTKGTSFLVEASTGFGKTACAMDVIAKVGKKTLVVVTKEDIRDQWAKAAKDFLGITPQDRLGFIQGDTFQVTGKDLVIAMVQSIAKEARYSELQYSEFGLVIWDEVHRVGADFFAQSAFRVPAKLRLGLSATPYRKDGRTEVIAAHIGVPLVVARGLPMTPRVIVRKSPWIMHRYVPHTPGKCGHVINMLARDPARNSLLVDFIYKAHKAGRTIIVQSDRKEHLEDLAGGVVSRGVSPAVVGFYVGGMSAESREIAKTKPIIFATYQMTAEATDIPWLDCLVMATPKSDVRQIAGRVLREYPDKREPVIFDLVDDASNVFANYWVNRRAWYYSIGADINYGNA